MLLVREKLHDPVDQRIVSRPAGTELFHHPACDFVK
jgi:hypothetical protein